MDLSLLQPVVLDTSQYSDQQTSGLKLSGGHRHRALLSALLEHQRTPLSRVEDVDNVRAEERRGGTEC